MRTRQDAKSITAGGVARNQPWAGGVATQDSATEEAKCRAVLQSVKEHCILLLLFLNKQSNAFCVVGDNHF
jgi:hypothetical protein